MLATFAVKALVRLRSKWEEPSILETPLIPSYLFSSGSSHHQIAFLPWHRHQCLFCYCHQYILFLFPKADLADTGIFFVHSAVARGTAEHLSTSPQTPTLHDDVLQTTAYTLEKDNQAVTGLLLLPRCWTSLFLCQNGRKAAGTGILFKATAGSTHQVSSDLQLGDCCNICNCLVSVGFISPLTKIPLLFSFIESWSSF